MTTREEQLDLFDIAPYLTAPQVEGLPTSWTPADGMEATRKALNGGDRTKQAIAIWGVLLIDLLLHKNARYGNSALKPTAVFAKNVSTEDRMGVRMDDKISRIMLGTDDGDGEDPEVDLMGYLLLRQVHRWMETFK